MGASRTCARAYLGTICTSTKKYALAAESRIARTEAREVVCFRYATHTEVPLKPVDLLARHSMPGIDVERLVEAYIVVTNYRYYGDLGSRQTGTVGL